MSQPDQFDRSTEEPGEVASGCDEVPRRNGHEHAPDLVGQRQRHVGDERGEVEIDAAREHDGDRPAVGIDAAGNTRLDVLHTLARHGWVDGPEVGEAQDARVLLHLPSKESLGCHD